MTDNLLDKVAPDDLAEVLDLASEPLGTLAAAAKDCGLDEKVVKRLIQRVRSQYQPVMSELATVKTSQLVKMLDDRAYRALSYLDDYTLAKASGKDLAIITGIMLEKSQLLKGQPTHILSVDERMSMNDLIPMVMKEALRRGMQVSLEGEMIDVTPGPPERMTRPRSAVKHKQLHKVLKAREKAESGEP